MAAANKFATILRRYTNSRMAMILVYTVLEWTLISLLLVNGVLSYAVARFAAFFGLKQPCVLCSTFLTGYRSFICNHHAGEISKLAYCSAHRKLAEVAEMCEDCCCSASSAAALMLAWMKRSEEGEDLDLRCSCCQISLESGFYSAPPWLLKSTLADKSVHLFGKQHPPSRSHSHSQKMEEEQLLEEEEEGTKVVVDQSLAIFSNNNDDSKILENICSEEERVVPVELIDYSNTLSEKLEADLMIVNSGSTSEEMKRVMNSTIELEKMETLMGTEAAGTEFVDEIVAAGEMIDFSILKKDKDIKFEGVTCSPMALHDNILIGEISTPREAEDIEDHILLQGGQEDVKALDEATCEDSMPVATEICEPCALEVNIKKDGLPEGPSQQFREQGEVEIEQVDASPACFQNVHRDLNEVEEERVPETPAYLEGMSALHGRFMFERRDSCAESVDGSITSEVEGSEPLTIDHLKATLKAERRALRALYLELEEERSASAISANQTMAMITRLQEEKAAMQMEALQYQRMMEEQSEYDQEALQLLNELMMKREKEKQELEKELEIYHERVLVYEARERKKNTKSKANGASSSSSATSSADDSDALSSDINGNDEYSDPESKENTPADNGILESETQHMIALDESLADFEEERLAILEQLKSLEKLLFLDDDKPSDNKKSPLIERFCQENGHGMNGHYESSSEDINRLLDNLDSKDMMVHSDKRSADFRGKQLLPLFDAVEMDNEEVLQVDQDDPIRTPQDSATKMALVQQKLIMSEEVDNVYERLQALEADREFLRHCISSLKKGDKGIRLLQEILQHLRDLRSVDLRVRTADDALAQHA